MKPRQMGQGVCKSLRADYGNNLKRKLGGWLII